MKKSIFFITTACLVLIIAVGSGFLIAQAKELDQTSRDLDAVHRQSFYALSDYVSNISATLDKSIYSSTASQTALLAAEIWRFSGAAQESLSSLPLDPSEREKLSTCLSQVGDYVYSLSRKVLSGGEISEEERETLRQLSGYCRTVSTQLSTMEYDMLSGAVSLSGTEEIPALNSSFTELEAEFAGYPTLIYDGPFSTHLQDRTSAFLYEMEAIDQETALQKAATFLGLQPAELSFAGESNGNIPQYYFSCDTCFISITTAGGFPSTMSKTRASAPGIAIEEAAEIARTFLEGIGFPSMEQNYYSISEDVVTFNFAYTENGVTIYSDLIKIGVALDNGEIISLDTQAYLLNHVPERALGKVEFSAEEAASKLFPELELLSSRLCVIPSGGNYELFCHELKCKAPDDMVYLCYFNVYTGAEEEILILIENESSILTL